MTITHAVARAMAGLAVGLTAVAAEEAEFLPGGPLAGLKLPLFKGQHGEAPGYPGCIPELAGKEAKASARAFTAQDQAPEVELYPDAVEHWRAYWYKYCPGRSFFDRQSQRKNFVAPALPGADAKQVESYAAPVYWVPRHAPVQDSGKKLAPVPVVRLKIGLPILKLDLGQLSEGMYAVRVIAAVPTAELRPFRKPAYLRCTINDGLQGEVTEYKRRIGYCDEFYSVAEFYFSAPAARVYTAELALDTGSEVDLLVHNISLDDCLAGTVRQPLKKGVVVATPRESPKAVPSGLSKEDRLARDEAIWNYLPPPNHQGSGNTFKEAAYYAIMPREIDFGVADKTRKEIDAAIGLWSAPGLLSGGRFSSDRTLWNLFLVHPKLGLKYTLDDMKAYRPLPDPFPYKDNGTGLYYVDEKDPGKGRFLAEIGVEVMHRIRGYPALIQAGASAWRKDGTTDAAHDAAVALVRYAYLYPSIESATYFCNLARDPGAYGRNMFDRRRETEAMYLEHYQNYLEVPGHYDALFDYIQGNEELARSITRFVPWVTASQDVIRLLDTYLMQITAKRILRYHYHTVLTGIADLAVLLGPSEVTAPWMDWLFSRTLIYPLPPAGIQDLMIVGHDREGAQYIGSTYYSQGEGAQRVAESLQRIKDLGVLPAKYDLTDPGLFPKPLAHCYWQLGITVAGLDFVRIADVCGPDKRPGATLGGITAAAVNGWKWSADPAFAWILKNKDARKDFADAEWARIEAAAATVKRAPWLDLKSRQLYNWAGVLEAGQELDDPLLRRAAYLRTGLGIGHDHADSLDLQYFMLGLPMTVDGGQRPGYTAPGDAASRVHNLVEVDGSNQRVQSWVSALSDGEGARYLRATAVPSVAGVNLYQRAIALVDADTAPATSYVFDVVRVSGGKTHAYCFHGPVSDEVTCNADMLPVPQVKDGAEPTPDQLYLKPFRDVAPQAGATAKETLINARFAGNAPKLLETTWRYSRTPGPGNEQAMLGNRFDATAPRRFTRLHLFDTEGMRVYRGDAICYQWNYRYVCQMARRDGGDKALESAFVALHEPYTDKPFIAERRLIDIPGNDGDARKAVAVEVKLQSGRTDLLVADGYPEKTRSINGLQVAAEFACYSTDRDGCRLASLTGGTLLAAPGVEIRAALREHTGTVTAVDYVRKQVNIDKTWPAVCAGGVFEIGSPARTTSYTLAGVKPAGDAVMLTLTRGADYFRSPVKAVDEKGGIVETPLKPALGVVGGLDKGFVASNEALTKFWRADLLGPEKFQLRGAPVAAADLAPQNAIRLWEYGVGDTVRQSTFVHVRRLAPGLYEVCANVAATVALPGKGVDVSADRTQWRPLPAKSRGDKAEVTLTADAFSATGRLYLRVL